MCKILYWKHRNLESSVVICFFFLSRFSSHTLTIHRTAGGGRGPSFVPLYLFHPLMNNETFICNFACEMTITHFYSQHLCLPDCCYLIRFITISNYHMIDWLMQCLFTWWIDTRFCYSDLTLETGGFELAPTITLVLQANQLTKCASHPGNLWKSMNMFPLQNKISKHTLKILL